MSEPAKKIEQAPESYSPTKKPEIIELSEQIKYFTAVETLIETIKYQGLDFEIIERPDVFWVGSMGFHEENKNADPSQLIDKIHPLWDEYFREEIMNDKVIEPVNPTANGVLTFNMKHNDLPNGMMIGHETYSSAQNPKYNLYAQPAGLYIRLKIDNISAKLIGKEKCEAYELYGVMKNIAKQNGYEEYYPIVNGISLMDVEYHDGAPESIYAYIPIRKIV